jgi:hypothetical protein
MESRQEADGLRLSHLHTYFLFPFAIDREVVLARHYELWQGRRWIDGLDDWIGRYEGANEISRRLGSWRRAPVQRFDADSRAYQEMVFFHPFVRRVFFDTGGISRAPGEQEALLRLYEILPPPDGRLLLHAEDNRGREATVNITSLRLHMFANSIGLLSIGIESNDIGAVQALWVNEMMRKIYPSSGRQRREGRIPSAVRMIVEQDGSRDTLVDERFLTCHIRAFQPPLSALVTSLLYFSDYPMQEYEPVLDERMIVYTYMAVDPATTGDGWIESERSEKFVSRALYVDHYGRDFRYEPEFTRSQMRQQIYRRWAHQGTYYGFTSYSNITIVVGESDLENHELSEGFLIHRMFDSRYYLMMIIALFYRATLLDFAELVALVSRRLHRDFEDDRLSPETIRMTNRLRSEFLNFYNYWHFDEIANKDEESEHFNLQCDQFRIRVMLRDTDREIQRMHDALSEYYQSRSTLAVNRLAMLSMILGAGAVFTGYFGMNFGMEFTKTFFDPDVESNWVHWVAIIAVSAFSFGAILFGLVLVVRNWGDYRDVLIPRRSREDRLDSLKKVDD